MPDHVSISPAGPSINASAIPVLKTTRLRLRAFELADLPAACALWADQDVVKFIGATVRNESEVWTSFARSFGHWALLGYGFWAIADRDSNCYLGEIGFLEGLRDLQPAHVGTPEVGWALAKSAWGKGYASEALKAVNQWSDRSLAAPRTVCIIDPGHTASLKVATKNGYQHAANAKLDASPILVLERLRQQVTV